MRSLTKLLLIAMLLFATAAKAQDVYIGMPKAELINTLGLPTSSGSVGSKEILKFSNGARIILRDGTVSEVEGIDFINNEAEEFAEPEESGNSFTLPEPPTREGTGRVVFENERAKQEAEQASQETADAPQSDANPSEDEQLIESIESTNPDSIPGLKQLGPISVPEEAGDFSYEEYMEQIDEAFAHEEPTTAEVLLGYLFSSIIHVGLVLLLTSIITRQTGVEIFFINRVYIALMHAAIYTLANLSTELVLGSPLPYLDHGLGMLVFLALVPKLTSAQNVNTIITVTLMLTFGFIALNFVIGWLILMTGLSFLRAGM